MGNRNAVITGHGPGRPSTDKPHKPFRKWERAMLKRTFEDLAARSASGKSIDKDTFLRFFCNVPGMLGERLFYVFNSHRTGEVDYDEFCQGIALYCFPESDTRILTSHGLLFLNEIEALQAEGREVLFGCYDMASKGLQYSQGELVLPAEPPQELLEFTSAGEEERWAEGSEQRDDAPHSQRVSLRVTPDHYMLVQTGDEQPHRLVPARELLSECSCPPASSAILACAHRRAQIRLLACAEAGYTPQFTEQRQQVQRALHLDDAHFVHFLELLGFWLGHGTLRSRSSSDVGVCFSQLSQADTVWLTSKLAEVGLAPSDWTLGVAGTLRVTEPAWSAFFHAEFGGNNSQPFSHAPLSPQSRTRSPPSTPSASSSSHRRSSSFNFDAADTATEQMTQEAEKAELTEGSGTAGTGQVEQHLPTWSLLELSSAEMRLLIAGLQRAQSDSSQLVNSIRTSSPHFRDQLMQAMLHCGYSATSNLTRVDGAVSAEQHLDKPVWQVSWSDAASEQHSGEQSACQPFMSRQRCINRVPYSPARDKRIWCVKVAHKDHLIIAQRAQRSRHGLVTRQSRPIIISNCRGTMEEKIGFVFRMFNLKGDGRVGKAELETMLNSFVFAAESIVSGRENEVSVIGRVPSLKGSAAAAARAGADGAAGVDGGGRGSLSEVGYRAFNVLQIDEEDNAGSDNEGNLPAATFHRTQPVRRQSLPHAYLMSHSTSSPDKAPFSASALTSPAHHLSTPSTPPPGPLRPRGGSMQQHVSASAGKLSSAGSFDLSSDDSGKRIQHMVDVAMRIARRSDTSQAASHATTTPPVKRIGSSSTSANTGPAASHHMMSSSPAPTAASAAAVDDGGDPQLTVYHFAQWIQEFPEVLQVLDLAFAGKQDGGFGRRAGQDGSFSSAHERDVSAALDRLHTEGTGSHLLGTLISALTSRGKPREPTSTSAFVGGRGQLHGRTFSVTSLISPHVTSSAGKGDGSAYGTSIGTDVMDDRRKKEGVDIRCQQCGWHVHIQYCYSCGKKVTLAPTSSVPSPITPATQAPAAATNGSGPSPTSATSSLPTTPSTAHPQLQSSTAAASASNSSGSPSSAASLTLLCSTCGVLFLSGHIKNCVECGFSMQRSGQKIEPPLVKSLSWQRKAAKSYTCEGELMKVGKTLKSIVTRWYTIRDNFMYTYARAADAKGRPTHVLFLEGCFVEAVNHEERNSKCKYGVEIIMNEEAHKSRFLYAHSSGERQQWMEAIRYHSNVHNVNDYYDIGEELGVGRFSSVRMGVSRQSGKQYAIKIIDKSDIDEKEREALRTEVAVLKLLNHPHIIKCKNVFETRKQMYIVMSFVRGGDLFDRIVKRKRFQEPTAQKIMHDLLSVVHYLHLRGIVHNDLKPENIMMASAETEDEIIIADFGLSKFAMDEERFTMAQGTLAYVSPEVLRGTGYGKEVDLWSCGVILYLLVSGSLPFDSTDRETIIEKTMEGRVPFERKAFASVSDECKSLIKGLLTIDVERRLTCQQALAHPWFRQRWNEAGERVRDVDSGSRHAVGLVVTTASASASQPPSPALLPSVNTSHVAAQLGGAPELYYNNSSSGGPDVDSSVERGEEDEEEEEEEEEEDESESKGDVTDTDNGGGRQTSSTFRNRFINISSDSDDERPAPPPKEHPMRH